MSVEFSAERRLLAEDELDPVRRSHYPDLEGWTHPELVELARFLRARRDRARDLISDLRRARRGKGGIGEGLGSERGLAAKKQVYARALKRVNARIAQTVAETKRRRALTAMHAALARRQAADEHMPSGDRHHDRGNAGMSSLPNRKPRPVIHGARIGSVSQAGRVAQAVRDAR
ncbi:MAG TPA: hypothetical protein VH855_07430 [Acetobacteraceae bacterium]|jgi:hypothetical protein